MIFSQLIRRKIIKIWRKKSLYFQIIIVRFLNNQTILFNYSKYNFINSFDEKNIQISKIDELLKFFSLFFFQKLYFFDFCFWKIFQKNCFVLYFFDENFEINVNQFVFWIDTHDRNLFYIYKQIFFLNKNFHFII